MLGPTWVCRIFESLFFKEIPKHGPNFFTPKSLTMGSDFQNFLGLSSPCEPRKFLKIFSCCGKIAKNGYLFFLIIPNNGYLFLEKLPLNMGMGSELPATHSRPIQIWDPPPGRTNTHHQYTMITNTPKLVFVCKGFFFFTCVTLLCAFFIADE